MNSYEIGFIKRAMQYGYTEEQAFEILNKVAANQGLVARAKRQDYYKNLAAGSNSVIPTGNATKPSAGVPAPNATSQKPVLPPPVS